MRHSMNMTVREAKQRLTLNNMSLRNTGYGDWRVAFAEVRDNEASAYYTDDLEDAVLTGMAMRRRMQDQLSRKYLATVA